MPNKILLIANRTCPCPDVLREVRDRAEGGHVLVVAPALNARLRHWVSDTDDAVRAARERLVRAVDWLEASGVTARGEIGDADPIQAIDDALVGYAASEIVIATYPAGRSNWLEKDILRRAHARSDVPILHLTSQYELVTA